MTTFELFLILAILTALFSFWKRIPIVSVVLMLTCVWVIINTAPNGAIIEPLIAIAFFLTNFFAIIHEFTGET